jgi:phosphate:Na+ symporter
MFIFFSGLALFLIGLEGSKRFLKSLSSSGIENKLKKLSKKHFLSLLLGILVTGILQSSSAVSIILIALIEGNLINLKTALLIMMGANIGTTLTVQLISLPILSFYPFIIIGGILLVFIGYCSFLRKLFFNVFNFIVDNLNSDINRFKFAIFYNRKANFFNNKYIKIGLILISFGVIFAGLEIMKGYFNNLQVRNIIHNLLINYGNKRIYGITIGIIITSLFQSSSAVTGIIVSLSYNNIITLPTAIAISLGTNIGTCITAFWASLTSGKTAKNLALGHFLFNTLGVIFIYIFFAKNT